MWKMPGPGYKKAAIQKFIFKLILYRGCRVSRQLGKKNAVKYQRLYGPHYYRIPLRCDLKEISDTWLKT